MDSNVCLAFWLFVRAGVARRRRLTLLVQILALTPVAASRPRRWRGALLHSDSIVRLEMLKHEKRPVSATADFFEVRRVLDVIVRERRDLQARLLFDRDHTLRDRILCKFVSLLRHF